MKWSDEAESAMARVPFFVRKRVRKRVEEEAARQSASVVILQHVHDCKKGYLNHMEREVRGFQVEACFGPSGCPHRASGAESMADQLEAMLQGKDLRSFLLRVVKGTLKLHHELRISVSDCPNGCSRPQIADVGLLGACRPRITDVPCTRCGTCVETCREEAIQLDGERGPVVDGARCLLCGQCVRTCPEGTLVEGMKGFRIQVGGKLGRHPRLGCELAGMYSPEEALRIVERCVDHHMLHCRHGERLGEVLSRAPLKL
jgi:dissimilatory sulfite reductase (desulfoviridin) alpha/beta subunit